MIHEDVYHDSLKKTELNLDPLRFIEFMDTSYLTPNLKSQEQMIENNRAVVLAERYKLTCPVTYSLLLASCWCPSPFSNSCREAIMMYDAWINNYKTESLTYEMVLFTKFVNISQS
uniref:Uncharacterized protein n=1 Tax=Glossina pallidipes TaxID=7398 RepID=A0A1A9ZXK0_GLOPL